MTNAQQREVALEEMQLAVDRFYRSAVAIGHHPFSEFPGLMTGYIHACRDAHQAGQDFTEFHRHSGRALPLHPVMSDYITEKLKCIFVGAKVLDTRVNEAACEQLVGDQVA